MNTYRPRVHRAETGTNSEYSPMNTYRPWIHRAGSGDRLGVLPDGSPLGLTDSR
jgi:hypothetical protein